MFLAFMIPFPYLDYAGTYNAVVHGVRLRTATIGLAGSGPRPRAPRLAMAERISGFVIGEPCSGLRTMMALLRPWLPSTPITWPAHTQGSSSYSWPRCPSAIAANILRVDMILFIAHYWAGPGDGGFLPRTPRASSCSCWRSSFLINELAGCWIAKGVRSILHHLIGISRAFFWLEHAFLLHVLPEALFSSLMVA